MNGHIFLPMNKKNVFLQGFWPKSVYLKCFGNQLYTVYLQGLHSSRPCISRPCYNLIQMCKLKLQYEIESSCRA